MPMIECPLHSAFIISRDRPAVLEGNRIRIYQDLETSVQGAAGYLGEEMGVQPGERVALCMPRSWDYLVALLALFRRGAIACPISTRLPPNLRDEQQARLAARQMITEPLPQSERPFEKALQAPTFDLDQCATLLFTSGSSGRPKIVAHSIGNHYYSALGANRNLRLCSTDRWLLSLPLYHVGGLGILFRCLLAGAAVAIPTSGADPGAEIMRCQATHLSLVPTQLQRLMAHPEATRIAAGLKVVLLGGAPAAPGLIRDALASGFPVYPTYGMTELTSQVCSMPQRTPPARRCLSAGPLLPYRELSIDPDSREILLRGPTLCQGYLNEAGAVEPATDAAGWFHSGDLGEWDEQNYLKIIGRSDTQFISGGENIHPEEIEAALMEVPAVASALVVPVHDVEFGQRPLAFVLMKEAAAALDDFPFDKELELLLPRFKYPVAYLPWPQEGEGGEPLKPDRPRFAKAAADQTKP